jgi:predicted LPLAT superfamily acyltransferase
MRQGWLAQRERGSRLAYQFMAWTALRLGRPLARALLHPISIYFVFFSPKATKGIRVFLERVLKRRVGLTDLYRHYHCFSATLLDRTFIVSGQFQHFDLKFHNAEVLLNRVDRGQGCLLLGSHLGSFEIVRAGGLQHRQVEIKLLMYEENAPLINETLNRLDPSIANSIIPVGQPDTMLRVKDCLDHGGLVGILGDRVIENDKVVSCRFLGQMAPFPSGPMLLASILKTPVILFFGLYRGANRYEVYFELFSEQVILDRNHRPRDLQTWTQRYAERLEHYCHLAPANWFNFYDFWDKEV